jgi:hypothetical protein
MLDRMADQSAPSAAATARTPWKYTRWGSIILSLDFYIGVPAGIAFALLPALNKAVAGMATTVLIALGGALVAMAAVVVAVETIFVTLLIPEYQAAFERIEGGIKAAARPYVIVAWVCAVGALLSFASALSWPGIPQDTWWLRWLAFSVPGALAAWGLLGSAQLVSLGAFHLEQRSILVKAIREYRQRRDKSSRNAS